LAQAEVAAETVPSIVSVPRDAMPDPFRCLVVEQAVTSAPENYGRNYSFLRNPGDCVGRDFSPERFAICETIQRKTKTAMPLDTTTEGGSGSLNNCISKGWVENDSFKIFCDAQRTMNVSFNVVVEPGIESGSVGLSQSNERLDVANGKITRGQVAIGIAK